MKILYVENEFEVAEDSRELYNSFTEANVEVVNPSDLDFNDADDDYARDGYDVVLADLQLDYDLMGSEILDNFDADRKALFTLWREDEAVNHPEVLEAFDSYDVIEKPGQLDLGELVEQSL